MQKVHIPEVPKVQEGEGGKSTSVLTQGQAPFSAGEEGTPNVMGIQRKLNEQGKAAAFKI